MEAVHTPPESGIKSFKLDMTKNILGMPQADRRKSLICSLQRRKIRNTLLGRVLFLKLYGHEHFIQTEVG